jgi:transcription initiation factor IIE alpha subunit
MEWRYENETGWKCERCGQRLEPMEKKLMRNSKMAMGKSI